MNITKERERFVKTIRKSYLRLEDGASPEEGDELLVYGLKRHNNGEVVWTVKEVVKKSDNDSFSLGDGIPIEPGYDQLIVQGTYGEPKSQFGRSGFEDITVVERSETDKCKDKIVQTVVQLWHLGWPDKYTDSWSIISPDDDYNLDRAIRPIREDDFKVTTVTSSRKAAHLGRKALDTREKYIYRLGISWSSWHLLDSTEQLKLLTHEMTHCIESNHKESFYREHAQLVANLMTTEARMKRVERLFDDPICWDRLRALVLKGVHAQPKEIDTTGHPHRLSACNAVVSRLEPILDYRYDVGMKIHLNPPDTIHASWVYNYHHSDPDDEYPSYDDLAPEGVEYVPLQDLKLAQDHTDEELYEYLQTLWVETEGSIGAFMYDTTDIPVVDEELTVLENSHLPTLLNRWVDDEKKRPGWLSSSHKIPVRFNSTERQ